MKTFFTQPIISTDNIPVDRKKSQKFIQDAQEDFCAYLLLMSGRIAEVVKNIRNDHDYFLASLKESIQVPCELDKPNFWGYMVNWITINEVELWRHRGTVDDQRIPRINSNYKVTQNADMPCNVQDYHAINEELHARFPSLVDLLVSGVSGTVKRSFRRICEFPDLLFAPIPLVTKVMRETVFLPEYENMLKTPGKTEAYSVQMALQDIVKGDTRLVLSERLCKLFNGNLRMLYPYRNKYSEIVMFEGILYDLEGGRRVHLPITLYRKNGTSELYAFAMPLPKQQIVYNLDLIERAEELKAVVICDSVEIAEANQENAPEGIVFTTWMCDDGHLEEVDLSPLMKAEEIAFLIVNHSGRSLAEQYLATAKVVETLHEVKGFGERSFSFYQAEFKYEQYRMPYDMETFFSTYQQTLGTLIAGSELEMNETEFQAMLVKAQASLVEPERHFWDRENNREESCIHEDRQKNSIPQFIVHPWIQRGEITGIYAKKNHGKSPLVYTLAIAATCYKEKGNVDLFPERMIVSVPEPTYRSHKVLSLDFELGQKEIDNKLKSIGGVYWPDPVKQPEAYQRSKGNLIVVNMQDNEFRDYYGKDLSSPENWQFIFDQIEKAKDKGIKGQPVDMVVIDTYNKFVGTESIKTNTHFTRLTRRLREMDIAVVLTGQLNAEEKPRGFQQKLDDEYCTLVIGRDDDSHAHSLEDTPHFIYLKNYRGSLKDSQLEEFRFIYPMNRKLTFVPNQNDSRTSEELEKDNLVGFVKRYKEVGHDYPEIASMLGMKEKTLYELVPASSLKSKGGNHDVI